MDSIDLIARENEFKKLNKQLEKKTESLMKEIEEVMQKPDFFAAPNLKFNLNGNSAASARKHRCNLTTQSPENSAPRSNSCYTKSQNYKDPSRPHKSLPRKNNEPENAIIKDTNLNNEINSVSLNIDNHGCQNKSSSEDVKRVICDCCVVEKRSDEIDFLYAFVSVNVKDNVLPQSYLKGKVTVESVCKCLAAKVKLMQEQTDKLQSAIDKKNKLCEAHLTRIAEMEGERLALTNAVNTMKSDTADMRAKYLAIQRRLEDKDRRYTEQRAATDRLSAEVRRRASEMGALEARCAAREEAVAALRQRLDVANTAEKECREATRSLCAAHEQMAGKLRAQITALRTRCERQRTLIANLRAQRTLLASERVAHALGERYCRLIEADDD